MRRFLILFFCVVCICFSAFAQDVKIVSVRGKVMVKKDPAAAWARAKATMVIGSQAEIKTDAKGECMLSFDDQMKNVLTIKGNSQVALQSIQPVSLNLAQGKVFALIDDIKRVEKFEIRTPTVVAGVRGTGESVESNNRGSTVKCFADTVYVQGQGQEQALTEGFGITGDEQGSLGARFGLSDTDMNEWRNFKGDTEQRRRDALRFGDGANNPAGAGLGELKGDRRDDYGDAVFENDRRVEKDRADGGSS
ncbi:MAG: FecR family protein, partial [Candidatus Omnitrophica bacterium]|nr:FecR family protein [Candidatus Omnitrophota bacterium]